MKGWQTSREFLLSLASCGTMGEGYICKQNIFAYIILESLFSYTRLTVSNTHTHICYHTHACTHVYKYGYYTTVQLMCFNQWVIYSYSWI